MPSTIVSRAGQSSAASNRSSHALFLPRRCTMLSASPSCRKSRRAITPLQRRFWQRIRNLVAVQRSHDVYLSGIKSYLFDVEGKPDSGGNLFYPRLAVYDGNTTRVAFDNNESRSTDAHIAYTATTGGWSTGEVAGREETGQASSSGKYSLSV